MAVKKTTWVQRFSLAFIPRLYGLASRLLFGSCRLRYYGREKWEQCQRLPGPFIAAGWHYCVFNLLSLHPSVRKGWVAMVSGSEDAEYVARVLSNRGDKTVRGSRRKGGLAALKEMRAWMKEGFDAAIVADGSQGPPREVQAGVILLASKTGAPIAPMAVSADRYLTFKSWDRTMVPKPFARLAAFYGEPLSVPSRLSAQELEEYRLELEGRLNQLYGQAWELWGKKEH